MPDVSVPLMAALTDEGYRPRRVVPAERGAAGVHTGPTDRREVDFSSPAAWAELHRLFSDAEGNPVGGIVNLMPLSEPFRAPGLEAAASAAELSKWLFLAFKEFEDDLCGSAEVGGGWILNVTALDGRFGLAQQPTMSLSGAGTLGVAKALSRECPNLQVRNLDVDPELKPEVLVSRLLEELSGDDDLLEVGLAAEGRWRLRLRESTPAARLTSLPIRSDSVVLATGGAYGITAEIARGLATAAPRLIVVGRSPLPSPEPPETRELEEPALREHFIRRMRDDGESIVPARIEKAIKRLLKDRAILANLAAFRKAGATVEYHSVDVRSPEQFGGLIDDVYERYGRIDGVLHGAGIIQDRLIRDKDPESFSAVFGTKAESGLILADKLRPETLKFLVFFSSVSGRFGNVGQADYSAANEFLSKLADFLDSQWDARVVAINWGPWDAGMVSDELRRIYASRGIDLIPISEGVRFFERELLVDGEGSPEVVISTSVEQIANRNVFS